MRPGEAFKDNQSFQFQCKCAATSATPSTNKRLQTPGCQIRFSRKNRLPVLTFHSEFSTLLFKRKTERGKKSSVGAPRTRRAHAHEDAEVGNWVSARGRETPLTCIRGESRLRLHGRNYATATSRRRAANQRRRTAAA